MNRWLRRCFKKYSAYNKNTYIIDKYEASYFDQINMTKNELEFDKKQFTPTNVNIGTWPKDYTDEP